MSHRRLLSLAFLLTASILPALAVARGSGRRAGALRPDLQEPAEIHPADRPPAGSDRTRRDAGDAPVRGDRGEGPGRIPAEI